VTRNTPPTGRVGLAAPNHNKAQGGHGTPSQLLGSCGGVALKESPQLQFSNAEVGLVSSAYLAGAVLGALFFG
jgi:hypothetical protein